MHITTNSRSIAAAALLLSLFAQVHAADKAFVDVG